MNSTPEQFSEKAQRIAMSAQEKSAMRHIIRTHMQTYRPVRGMSAAIPWMGRHAWLSSFAVALLVIGGVGISATKAEPGDLLYDFRTDVNDRVQAALVFNEDDKFDVETQQIERQLAEEDAAAIKELQNEEDSDTELEQGDADDSYDDNQPSLTPQTSVRVNENNQGRGRNGEAIISITASGSAGDDNDQQENENSHDGRNRSGDWGDDSD